MSERNTIRLIQEYAIRVGNKDTTQNGNPLNINNLGPAIAPTLIDYRHMESKEEEPPQNRQIEEELTRLFRKWAEQKHIKIKRLQKQQDRLMRKAARARTTKDITVSRVVEGQQTPPGSKPATK